jgi:hypothetical protein
MRSNYHGQKRVKILDLIEHLEFAHARHAHIADDDVASAMSNDVQGLVGARRNLTRIALLGKTVAQPVCRLNIVISN